MEPQYLLQGVEKFITAAISVATVWGLWLILPKILAIPSRMQLETVIDQLRAEIIERKNAEMALRESEERFHIMVESVKDYAIFMITRDGIVSTWNKGAEQIKGYKAEEIIGQSYRRFFTLQDLRSDVPGQILEMATKEGRFETQGLRVRRDGSTFWADVVVTPLYDAKSELIGYVKVTRDISEKKAAEKALSDLNHELEQKIQQRTQELKKREEQLVAITNAVPYMIAEIDTEETLLFGNDLFHRLVIKDPELILGRQLREFLDASRYTEIRDFLDEAKLGKQVSLVRELQIDGSRMILQVNYIPEFDAQQQVFAIILVASDITQHVLTEEELKEAKEYADAANLAKSAFLANMSHEIRTPLGAVLGFSELIARNSLKEEERDYFISAIRRNGHFLLQIINDILDLSKIEAGKIDISIREVAMTEIFSDLTTLLKLQAQEKNIELKFEHDDFLPVAIQTDPLRLKQILLNIIGNAIKFTEKGWVRVSLSFAKNGVDKNRLVFVVEDSGIGISKENALKLFTPFTQADATYKRKFGGTGLGLVLSKHLANLLGGDVVLTDSKPGKGSTFTITIDPGNLVSEQFSSVRYSDLMSSSSPVQAKPSVDTQQALKGMNILVIDDAPDNLALVSYHLGKAGVLVETAGNGAEAIDKVSRKTYQILLMDLQMPIMDGFEATAALRNSGYDFPIIALTAHAFEENRRKCLESGFTDFLSKPIDSRKMMDCLAFYSKTFFFRGTNGI